jgi:hypothetical protein
VLCHSILILYLAGEETIYGGSFGGPAPGVAAQASRKTHTAASLRALRSRMAAAAGC